MGSPQFGTTQPPKETLVSLITGTSWACGLTPEDSLSCWGLGYQDGPTKPPRGEFISVSSGRTHTCGLTKDASIVCWGYDGYGQASPPAGKFTAVFSGAYHSCGLRTDKSLACWGHDIYGQSSPPPGEFTSVSVGAWHTCAVKEGGTVVCLGEPQVGGVWNDASGEPIVQPSPYRPPGGDFISIDGGTHHNCGVKTDGSVECWGSNKGPHGSRYFGQSTPPTGNSVTSVRGAGIPVE